MKRLYLVLLSIFLVSAPAYSQSEAGAIFLLIAPGARAGGMGEAHVAVSNDAYASYWNPAGLGFLKGTELALMHVNWLPGLANDMYYEFLSNHFKVYSVFDGESCIEILKEESFDIVLLEFNSKFEGISFRILLRLKL